MKYLSLFSGIGGFEKGIDQATGNTWDCVGFSEINKYASAIYKHHYPNHKNYGDVSKITTSELPNFNLLVGGFPCQSFSIAGKRGGFNDTRGTLFFEISRILQAKRPEWILLENVKGLLNHDSGKTIATIYEVLTGLGYTVGWEVVNSCHFGVPQNRERIFIVGHLTEAGGRTGEVLPVGEENKRTAERTEQAPVTRTFTAGGNSGGLYSSMTLIASGINQLNNPVHSNDRVYGDDGISPTLNTMQGGNRQPFVFNRKDGLKRRTEISPTLSKSDWRGLNQNQDKESVLEDGKIRRLTPVECERLQGFPDGWTEYGIIDGKKVEISDTQRYKALGNAVTVNVIEAIISKISGVAE